MFKFAIDHAVIVTVAILIICLLGIVSIFRVPIQMIPDLDVRVIRVDTAWPGATPQDIEKEIIIEQEEYLGRIPNLERLTSNASTGNARIELEFPSGIDLNQALINVNNALSQMPGYPENVDEPRIVTRAFSDNSFLHFRAVPLPGNPLGIDMPLMLDFIKDYIAPAIERVPGVSEMPVWGGRERQVRIYIDPVKLAERSISLTELRNVIRSRNRDVSGGDLDSGKRRYLLRTKGRFNSLEELEDMIIVQRGNAFIRLRDVGYAELSGNEIRSYAYLNDQHQITMGVRRELGSNVIETKDRVEKRVTELNEGLLKEKGLQLSLTSNDVDYVKNAISIVWQNLLIGAILAILVLYLFLRSLSATAVGAIGIPICTIASFLGLLLFGRTINVISLAGVAFAIGMTLDNSIVVLENIYRHMVSGKSRIQATIDGVREVWSAVLASTLTTVFVFIPILFVGEEVGQLYSDIAIAVSSSIIMSMLIAITVIPVACSHFISPASVSGPSTVNWIYQFGQNAGDKLMTFVEILMRGKGRRITLVAGVIILALAIQYYLTPAAEYLPEGEESKVFVRLTPPPGYNLEEMHGIYNKLKDDLLPFVDEDPEKFENGEIEFPPLEYVLGRVSAERIFLVLHAVEISQADALVDAITRKTADIPGMKAFATRGSIFASNSGGTRSINVDISGSDLPELFEAGFKSYLRANEIFQNPRVRLDPSSLTMGQPLLEIRPDWERAAELGIDADQLGYTIWAYSDGAYVDEFFIGDDKIDMYLYSTQGGIDHPKDIEHIMLYSSAGGIVPLNAVATVEETVNTETIRRVNGSRTITLRIIPPNDIPLETGVEIVERDLIKWMKDTGVAKGDIYINLSGASDLLKATREAMAGNFFVAILISYLLMVAIFSHWGYPLLIMTTVPIGISGGIVGLWLLNIIGGHLDLIGFNEIQQPFDMITMLGFLILIGTVVNNPILIVEKSMRFMQDSGMKARDAVLKSTRARLRPIMMSMITTVCGLSPLVFNPGAGTELYRGLGAIVLFGLLFSSLITLSFMPSLLSLILEWREKLHTDRAREVARSPVT